VLTVAGVLRPSAGRVLLGDRDLTSAPPERIDISSPRELDKWSRRLDVTHDRLREAVLVPRS